MLFTKPASFRLVWLLCLTILLASCGGKQKKTEDEPKVLTPEQIRIMELVKFGPDPYLASAPDIKPEDKPAYDALIKEYKATVKLLSTDEAAAEAKLKEYLEKYPSYSGPAYNLGILEQKRGNAEAAKDYFNMAIKRNPNNLNARNELALIYRDEGNFGDAEKEYLDIIKRWGGYLTAYKNLGILYDLYLGRFEEALPYYKKYNSLIPEPDKQVTGWIIDIERRMAAQSQEAEPQPQQPEATTDSTQTEGQ